MKHFFMKTTRYIFNIKTLPEQIIKYSNLKPYKFTQSGEKKEAFKIKTPFI